MRPPRATASSTRAQCGTRSWARAACAWLRGRSARAVPRRACEARWRAVKGCDVSYGAWPADHDVDDGAGEQPTVFGSGGSFGPGPGVGGGLLQAVGPALGSPPVRVDRAPDPMPAPVLPEFVDFHVTCMAVSGVVPGAIVDVYAGATQLGHAVTLHAQ